MDFCFGGYNGEHCLAPTILSVLQFKGKTDVLSLFSFGFDLKSVSSLFLLSVTEVLLSFTTVVSSSSKHGVGQCRPTSLLFICSWVECGAPTGCTRPFGPLVR